MPRSKKSPQVAVTEDAVLTFPTPEMAAKENAFHAREYRIECAIRKALEHDDERLLRTIFEDSQLKLEIDDNYKPADEVDAEVEQAVDDARSEMKREAEGAITNLFDDAMQDGLSLEEVRNRAIARMGQL
jgi:hypothetical protein